MAEYLLQRQLGSTAMVESAGVYSSRIDPLVVAVLEEIGIDAHAHMAQSVESLRGGAPYHQTIALSHHAQEVIATLPRKFTGKTQFWDIPVPEDIMGNREQKLYAYRQTRDRLLTRLEAEFLVTA